MRFVVLNGVEVYVPAMLPSKETLDAWPYLHVLHFVELFSIFAVFPGAVLIVITLSKSIQFFHKNLIQVVQIHLVYFTTSEVSRILILFYDAGILQPRDSFDGLLFVAFFIRFASLCATVTIIPAIIAERTFASLYIGDYEKVSRPWISCLVNGSSIFLSSIYYLLIQLGLYSMLVLILITIFVTIFSTLAILAVFRRDVAKLRDLSNKTGRSTIYYTLSMKFQLEENVRVTKLLTNASIGMLVWMIGSCAIFGAAFVIYGEENTLGQLSYAILNVYIALSLAIVVWLSLATSCDPHYLPKRLARYICCSCQFIDSRPALSAKIHDPHVATEKYFGQLQSAWIRMP